MADEDAAALLAETMLGFTRSISSTSIDIFQPLPKTARTTMDTPADAPTVSSLDILKYHYLSANPSPLDVTSPQQALPTPVTPNAEGTPSKHQHTETEGHPHIKHIRNTLNIESSNKLSSTVTKLYAQMKADGVVVQIGNSLDDKSVYNEVIEQLNDALLFRAMQVTPER